MEEKTEERAQEVRSRALAMARVMARGKAIDGPLLPVPLPPLPL